MKENKNQGKPVAFLCTKKDRSDWHHIVDVDYEYLDNWRANPAILVQPLYTHADPAEVERYPGELQKLRVDAAALAGTVEGQLAQLAEAQALLSSMKRKHDGLHRDMATIAAREVPKGCPVADYAAAAIADSLSASAEPSASHDH